MKSEQVKNVLGSLLFPEKARCCACGDISGSGTEFLCPECRRLLRPRLYISKNSAWGRDGIGFCRFAMKYASPAGALVKLLKYGGVKRCAPELVRLMQPAIDDIPMDGYDCIVPVPLHREREWERGFNQALLLAEGISERTGIPVDTELKRLKRTRRQARVRYNGRGDNVKDAFGTKADFTGMRILLVDDIITSGSTLNACSRALKKAGASRVDAVCAVGSMRCAKAKGHSYIYRK